jgi:Na+-translocating ferredoxin:NAD+ oxidoreductase subunit G
MIDSVPSAPLVSSRHMMATLGITALVAGVLVVAAFEITRPQIEANRRQVLEQTVLRVLPGASTRQSFVVSADQLRPLLGADADGVVMHAGYDHNGRLVGIAAEAAARGYQDIIRLLYAYSPDCECITAIHVLSNKDTPGIGDKIGTDPAFLANFRALAAQLNAERNALAHTIVTVKHGKKVAAWEIDAISGATVSSRAVGKALNDSAQRLVPVMQQQLTVLTRVPRETP